MPLLRSIRSAESNKQEKQRGRASVKEQEPNRARRRWFKNGNQSRVEVVTLDGLLAALEHREIGLPSFQRGRVWNAPRIAFLWDSLLRGYPIGSLMVIPRDSLSRDQVRGHQSGTANEGLEWLLLDGQQRCAAIALASTEANRSTGLVKQESGPRLDSTPRQRLWIDLGEFRNGVPSNGRRSPFYLTTLAHPWGVGVSDGQPTPAKESEKRRGRECLAKWINQQNSEPEDLWRFCREESDQNPQWKHRWTYPDPWLSLRYTWPEQAADPAPIDDLISTLREANAESVLAAPDGRIDAWLRKVRNRERESDNAAVKKALRTVYEKLRGILNYELVLIQVPTSDANAGDESIPERLNDVFQRINRQGANLSDAELFFSTVKMHYPGAHNAVEEIYQDEKAGKVLNPLQIVHGAARLARSEPGLGDADPGKTLHDLPRLTLSRYRNLVSGKDDDREDPFLGRLIGYLHHKDENQKEKRRLYSALKSIRKALSYCPKEIAEAADRKDIGIPLPLLARLSWKVWHTLVAWGVDRDHKTILENRGALVRYALIYHFYNNSNAAWDIQHPFLIGREKGGGDEEFPVDRILRELNAEHCIKGYVQNRDHENGYPRGILKPEHYDYYVKRLDSWILHNERDLLFWVQRESVHRWFNELYDPLHHGRGDDKPFDIDHVVPDDWFKYVNGRCDQFVQVSGLRSSVGNLRVWPQSLNRSEGNKAPSERWLLGDESKGNEIDDKQYGFWGLARTDQVLLDSAIDPNKEMQYLKEIEQGAEGGVKDWKNPQRCEAFRCFANERRARFYREFYDALNLGQLEGALCDVDLAPLGASTGNA